MVVIGYGIAALIVIILLIVFNVRTASNRSNPEPARDSEQTRAAVEPPQTVQEEKPEAAVIRPERTGTTQDQSYRNALRNLQTGQAARKPAPTAGKKTADEEYREAMRNLRSSKDRKE
jgi:hypothetical protein